jgi:hypothetical protein
MAGIHAKAFMNANRDVKKQPNPVELVFPWSTTPVEEEVTPEERAALKAKLLRHSAFAEK